MADKLIVVRRCDVRRSTMMILAVNEHVAHQYAESFGAAVYAECSRTLVARRLQSRIRDRPRVRRVRSSGFSRDSVRFAMEVLVETIAFEPNREDLLEHYSVKLMEVRQWAIAEREKKEKKSHG